MFLFKRNSNTSANATAASTSNPHPNVGELPSRSAPRAKQLLVIDGDRSHDWARVFEGAKVRVRCALQQKQEEPEEPVFEELAVQVTQAGWATLAYWCWAVSGCAPVLACALELGMDILS